MTEAEFKTHLEAVFDEYIAANAEMVERLQEKVDDLFATAAAAGCDMELINLIHGAQLVRLNKLAEETV